MSSTKTSKEKLREKTFLKHLQKRRKRKIPLLRGIYHNKMLKILVILVCSVNILYHLNIIQIAVEAESTTTPETLPNITSTSPTSLRNLLKPKSEESVNLRNKTIRRSINVNSSFNHQNEIVQNKPSEHHHHHNQHHSSAQNPKRKLRRKPPPNHTNRTNHTRTGLGPSTRFKGKRRKYPTRPTSATAWQHQLQNRTHIYKPKINTTIRTTASTSISSSTSSSNTFPFLTQQQQQFSYTNRSYQRQHQFQQQSVQIPSSTIRVSSTIDHHVQKGYDNSTATNRYYPTTNIKHYIGVNSTSSIHDLPFQQQNVVIQGNTDIVVYRNIGPVPCPPGVRLVTHRVITATPDPRINRQRGKNFENF